MSIAACFFVHNDLPSLRISIPYASKWADQVCVLDLGSNDGTKDFCEAFLHEGVDVYQRRTTNTCPTLGFAEAKNASAAMATTDWYCYMAADMVMNWRHHGLIHTVVNNAESDVLSCRTIGVAYSNPSPLVFEEAVRLGTHSKVPDVHRRLFRRSAGITAKGYIHEEPYKGELNCCFLARETRLEFYHMRAWGNEAIRSLRYSWMIQRAILNPELKRYTNPYWYEAHYAKHRDQIIADAAKYEVLIAANPEL